MPAIENKLKPRRPEAQAIALSGGAWSDEEEAAFKAPIREQYERQGDSYYASARM